jgi:hypothetical protein
LSDFCGFEVWESQSLIYFLPRPKDLDLPHVGVLSGMLVLEN